MAEKFDLVVVGGGPGGYPAAIRAAQLGLNVALVEADKLGGECTNYGCIPTKAMIKAAEAVTAAALLPFIKGRPDYDFKDLMEWVTDFSKRISQGVEYLLKGYGVELVRGRARIEAPGFLSVDGDRLRYEKLVVSVGTSPAFPRGLEPDGSVVHDNRSILGLRRKPGSMLIIGGGYIGVEYAAAMARLGVEVHLVEALDRILPLMDKDFSRIVERHLKKLGVKIYTGTIVEEMKRGEASIAATLKGGNSIEADIALVATGRRPNTAGLGLERIGVRLNGKGYITVNDGMETSAPGVYAAGDVAGPPLLAHKAFLQAVVAAERAAGDESAAYDAKAVPQVVYTEPEIASTGFTLEEARKQGIDAEEKRLPLGSLARVSMEGCSDCFAKIVYERSSKAVLGFHIAAPHASEIIAAATLAIEMGATLEDIALTIHPHPTVSEALKEAAELALERPIHFLLKRK